MNKFDQYMKRLELTELVTESTNTFTYNLPEDRPKRLFDFYTFSSLSPLVDKIQQPEPTIKKDITNPDNISVYGSRKLNTNFIDSFWNAHDKCYIELAKEMMDDILFCISAEFKHIDQDPNYTNVEYKIPENLNRELYKDYVKKNLDPMVVPPKKGEEDNGNYGSRYITTIKAIAKSGGSILDFVKLCSYVYDNFRFHGAYAGPKWADAANSFLDILNALPEKYRPDSIVKPLKPKKELDQIEQPTETKSLSGNDPWHGIKPKSDIYDPDGLLMGDEEDAEESQIPEIPEKIEDTKTSVSYELTPKQRLALFVAIDHTWGLSHNTGPTFNKLQSFKKIDGSASWLAKALDKRTQDENLFRFINNTKPNQSDVSSQMIPIIKRVVYSYYGATNEDELYQHVTKTNPVKIVPIHVSDEVYRSINFNPLRGVTNSGYSSRNVKFNSHYNHWCTLSFEIYKSVANTEDINKKTILAFYFTDEGRIEGLATDNYDFKFTKNGIESDGSYISDLLSFKLKHGEISTTYELLIAKLIKQIKDFGGVKIDPLKMSAVSKIPDITLDKLKDLINFNDDNTLNRVLQFASKYDDTKIDSEGISIPSGKMMIQFISAPKSSEPEISDKTYGSPDNVEDYFAGKRKKIPVKSKSENAKIRFTFKADQTLNKTMEFIDKPDELIKKVIIDHVRKIDKNENGVEDENDKVFKNLKHRIVEDFSFGEVVMSSYFDPVIPKPYNKMFTTINHIHSQLVKISGDKGYMITLKLDPKRLTSPYSIDITNTNEQSILNKEYKYSSMDEIKQDFKNIFKMMIEDIKDSEKEEFTAKLGDTTVEDILDNLISYKDLSYPSAVKKAIIDICKDEDQPKISNLIYEKLAYIIDEIFRNHQSCKFKKVNLHYNDVDKALNLDLILDNKENFHFYIKIFNDVKAVDYFEYGTENNIIKKTNETAANYNKVLSDVISKLKEIEQVKSPDEIVRELLLSGYQQNSYKYQLISFFKDKINKDNVEIFRKNHPSLVSLAEIPFILKNYIDITKYDINFLLSDTVAYLVITKKDAKSTNDYGPIPAISIFAEFDTYDPFTVKLYYTYNVDDLTSHKLEYSTYSKNLKSIEQIAQIIKKGDIESTSEVISKYEPDSSNHPLIEFIYNKVKRSTVDANDIVEEDKQYNIELFKGKIIALITTFIKASKGLDIEINEKNVSVTVSPQNDNNLVSIYLRVYGENDFTLFFDITNDSSTEDTKIDYEFNDVSNEGSYGFSTISPEWISNGIIKSIKDKIYKKSNARLKNKEAPEIKKLVDAISLAAKADIRSSGLASFVEPTLQSFIDVIRPYKDRLTYIIKSNYSKTPQGVEVLSIVAPMKYNTNGKIGQINANIYATFSKENPSVNKITLYDDPQDVKSNPSAIADILRDYLAEKFLVKKPLKDSVNADVYNLVRAFLLKS